MLAADGDPAALAHMTQALAATGAPDDSTQVGARTLYDANTADRPALSATLACTPRGAGANVRELVFVLASAPTARCRAAG